MIRSFEKRAGQKISGFQSPAADYLEGRLDLSEKLIVDPHSTFYFQMQGDAMISCGIFDGDLLVIDRSLKPVHGAFVIAFISGNFSCRLFLKECGSYLLKNDTGRSVKLNWVCCRSGALSLLYAEMCCQKR